MPGFAFAVPDHDPRSSGLGGRNEPVPPVWFAFRYTVADGATRAAAWRALRDLSALNIQRRLWAVGAGEGHGDRLQELAARIRAAGGEASLAEVGTSSADDARLHSRVRRACERLWDELASEADWYGAHGLRGPRPVEDRVEELTRLTELFGSVVGVDIARSDAGRRAEIRLARLVDDLLSSSGVDALAWCRSRPPRPRHSDLTASCALADGTVWYVAGVRPTADPLWERAFTGFESATYRPSADRVPLRAGTFRWVGPPGTAPAALERVNERIRRFEAALH